MSCKPSNKELQGRLINSDSVAINYFRGDGKIDTVLSVKIIRDKQKIEQLAILIAEKSVDRNFKCGYDGSIHFFKINRVIQDIDFRMNEAGCMHFSFLLNGKQQATALSPGAKELITSFRR